MIRVWTLALLGGALLVASPHAGAQGNAPQALPAWLAGYWQAQDGAAWADEMWNAPRGGVMLGAGRAGMGPQTQTWESMRIVVRSGGTIAYYAQPKGRPAIEFPAASIGEDAIEFANASHDYPQRIRYWRQGQLLMAEIARIDGSDAQRWNYRPAALGQ